MAIGLAISRSSWYARMSAKLRRQRLEITRLLSADALLKLLYSDLSGDERAIIASHRVYRKDNRALDRGHHFIAVANVAARDARVKDPDPF